MLSVLIPIYNFDVRDFVRSLSEQASVIGSDIEIICLDDASDPVWHNVNAEVGAYPYVKYFRLPENAGRSAVRNRLAEMARHDHLVYLDCDGRCVSGQFLRNYMSCVPDYDVVYGGRVYCEEAPDDHSLYFHWYCGSVREAILVEERKKNPFKSFMTNNFLIRREVYDAIGMDESLSGYGHEDTLFAIELRKHGFRIDHIENPIEHIGIEPVDVFLSKSENGVRNLAYLLKKGEVDDSVKLVKYYHRLASAGLAGIVSFAVLHFQSQVIKNLKSAAPNLLWFDLWKLAKLHKAMG